MLKKQFIMQEYKSSLKNIIKQRLEISGISQGNLAKIVGVTPAQISLFLNGKSSLSLEVLEKVLQELDINLDTYARRLDLAKKVASKLDSKISVEEIIQMDKKEMINMTKEREIAYLIDVNDRKSFDESVKAGLIEPDCYYAHFRMLVAHIHQLGKDGITTKKASQSVSNLYKVAGTMGMIMFTSLALIGFGAVNTLTGNAIGIAGRKMGVFSSFIALASSSLQKGITQKK